MTERAKECLICGEPIIYFDEARELECSICHRKFVDNVTCADGHYVCNECHRMDSIDVIEKYCKASDSKNPIEIMEQIMRHPAIHMHGPEHHVLIVTAIITAYKNCGGDIDYDWAMKEALRRGQEVPGGICGFWGSCGSGIGSGIAYSIIMKATPLTEESWGKANLMTARALKQIGEIGGPRCCKRNTRLAVTETAKAIKEDFGIEMEITDTACSYKMKHNEQCIGTRCPFFK